MVPDEARPPVRSLPGNTSRSVSERLICLLVLLLPVTATPGNASADAPPPRVSPLIGRDFEPTWRWYTPGTPTPSPGPNQYALAIDNRGRVHVFWDTVTYGAPRYVYHSFAGINQPQSWSQPAPVARSLGESTLLSAPVPGPDGTLHLLWHNLAQPNYQQQLLYAAFRGGTWSQHEIVYQAGGDVAGMIRADSAGQVNVAVVVSFPLFSSDVYQVTHSAQNVWGTPESIPRDHPSDSAVAWPDAPSGVHLFEQTHGSPPLLYHSYWRDGSYVIRDSAIAVGVYDRGTALDSAANLHTYWSDLAAVPGRNIWALHHQCVEGSARLQAEEVPSGELAISDFVSATDANGRFALAWRDETGAVRLGLWQGCSRSVIRTVPLPAGSGWQLRTLALSADPDTTCVLLTLPGWVTQHAVVCGGTE